MPISEAQEALGIKDDRPSQEGNSEGTEMVRESPLRRAFCCLGMAAFLDPDRLGGAAAR